MKANFRLGSERGIELIEFALVLPFLLLLTLGTIEFGRIYYTYNTLTKAVRDGARYAATSRIKADGTWVATEIPSVETRTRNLVVYGIISPTGSEPKIISDILTSQINVSPQRISDTEQYVTVSAGAYPYSPLFSLIIPTSITLSPTVKMLFIGRILA